MTTEEDQIEVENINTPGRTSRVNRSKYDAMKFALLTVLPFEVGQSYKIIKENVLPHLPDDLFPGGATAGWWLKTVQLDLEAKGIIVREASKPLRWHRV